MLGAPPPNAEPDVDPVANPAGRVAPGRVTSPRERRSRSARAVSAGTLLAMLTLALFSMPVVMAAEAGPGRGHYGRAAGPAGSRRRPGGGWPTWTPCRTSCRRSRRARRSPRSMGHRWATEGRDGFWHLHHPGSGLDCHTAQPAGADRRDAAGTGLLTELVSARRLGATRWEEQRCARR